MTFLTSGQAALMLDVSSINTIKNWLEGGHFPGARRTVGGHWRFPLSEVEKVLKRIELLEEKNRKALQRVEDTDESPNLANHC